MLQTEKYGVIEKGELKIVATADREKTACKAIKYASIPKLDQLGQAVFQAGAIDKGDIIEVGVDVREVVQDDREDEFEIISPIIKEPITKG